ncbi:MAG: hypothetical protein U1E56_14250 [Bauldia sp.]
MTPRFARLAALLAGLLVSATGATAAGLDFDAMLQLIPAGPQTYASWPLIGYVDYRAIEAAAGVRHPPSETAFKKLPEAERAAWLKAMRRVAAGPQKLGTYGAHLGSTQTEMLDAMGFDFLDVDRALTFWDKPPGVISVLSGGQGLGDVFDVDGALVGRGYAHEIIDGADVWHRFNDGASAFRLTDPGAEADPFDGDIMRSERIVAEPGLVVAATTWADLSAVIAVRAGTASPDSAGDLIGPAVAAMARLAGAPPLQVFALPLTAFADRGAANPLAGLFGGLDPREAMERLTQRPAGRPLVPFPLAVFADFATAAGDVAVVAIPYPDHATAQAEMPGIAERFRTWRSLLRNDREPMLARYSASVEAASVEMPDYAGAVARGFIGLAEALADKSAPRLPASPAAAGGSGSGGLVLIAIRTPRPTGEAVPGAVFHVFLEALFNRDFSPLALQ